MTKNDRAPIIAATPLHLLLCLVSLPALAAPAVTLTFTPGEQLALPEYKGTYRWQKLTNAAAQQGVVIDGKAHRALADVQMTLGVIKAMAKS